MSNEKKHNLNVKVDNALWDRARIKGIELKLNTVPAIIEAALQLLVDEP